MRASDLNVNAVFGKSVRDGRLLVGGHDAGPYPHQSAAMRVLTDPALGNPWTACAWGDAHDTRRFTPIHWPSEKIATPAVRPFRWHAQPGTLGEMGQYAKHINWLMVQHLDVYETLFENEIYMPALKPVVRAIRTAMTP